MEKNKDTMNNFQVRIRNKRTNEEGWIELEDVGIKIGEVIFEILEKEKTQNKGQN